MQAVDLLMNYAFAQQAGSDPRAAVAASPSEGAGPPDPPWQQPDSDPTAAAAASSSDEGWLPDHTRREAAACRVKDGRKGYASPGKQGPPLKHAGGGV